MTIKSFFGEYRFLSNFWPVEIEYEGLIYPAVEHAYQAAKTHDPRAKVQFTKNITSEKAKKLGKTLELREDWDKVKLEIMENLVRRKFAVPELRENLLNTGEQELIEGNYWGDTFWGVCNKTNKGENYLGKILMRIRDECRKHEV